MTCFLLHLSKKMQNIFVNNYLFIYSTATCFDVYMPSLGNFFSCVLRLQIDEVETIVQMVVTNN